MAADCSFDKPGEEESAISSTSHLCSEQERNLLNRLVDITAWHKVKRLNQQLLTIKGSILKTDSLWKTHINESINDPWE